MYMNLKFLIVMVGILSVAGCSNMPRVNGYDMSVEARLGVFGETGCCIKLADAKPEPLKDGVSFSLEEHREKIQLPEGESFFKLFELPNDGKEHKYVLRSFVIEGDGISPHAVIPVLYFLDDDFQVTRKSSFQYVKYMDKSLIHDPNYYLYFELSKNNEHDEKYVVVATDSQSIGKKFTNSSGLYKSYTTVVVTGKVYSASSIKNEPSRSVLSSPSGALIVREFRSFLNTPPNFNDSVFSDSRD